MRRTNARGTLRTTVLGLATFVAAVAVIGSASPAAAAAGAPTTRPDHLAAAQHAATEHAAAQRQGRWRVDPSATTLDEVARAIGADRLWDEGVTGRGIGVALVDTGVVPVSGLRSGNVVNGPDLSVESQAASVRHLDTNGHGTHLAGIVAGSGGGFRGVAPDATLTSVKVGAFDGTVDVSQVIAAIDWVVEHRNDDPRRPIRVLNLAYGTDGVQDYRLDPLTHAVENAWRAGIVVVAAAGNGGSAAPKLVNPAYDPYVIAVGAADTAGTPQLADDSVAEFSSRGDASRGVDLVAPGRSIVSLRNPGGYVDSQYPDARVGERLFKGSGTSQASAVVSGAVALLLDDRPDLTPDQVKALLTGTATRLPRSDAAAQGAGELDIAKASRARQPGVAQSQSWPRSTGLGSLEAARGSAHLGIAGVSLTGESDLFGPFDTAAWAAASTAGTAWVDGRWMGRELTGTGWGGSSWTGITWSGITWSGITWSGITWSGITWSGLTWSGITWSGITWSGITWSGITWSGITWSGITWSDCSWTGITWSDAIWS